MFAIIKSLFGRRETLGARNTGSRMTSALGSNRPLARPSGVSTNPTTCPPNASKPHAAQRPAQTSPASDLPVLPTTESISLPLGKILARFPQELQAVITSTPAADLHIALPLAEILEQLGRGIVRVPFGIIRHAAPSGFFAATANFDPLPVTLPLDEIICRISPAQLPRRATQKQITVPESVLAPFQGGVPSMLAPVEFKPAPEPAATPAVVVAAPQLAQAAPVAHTLAPSPAPVTVAATAAPARGPAPVAPVVSPVPQPVAVAPAPSPAPVQQAAPAVVAAALAPTSGATLSPRSDCLVVSLHQIIHNWPQGVLQEITLSQLAGEQAELPLAEVESGLKVGRLAFTWQQIRAWIPALPKPLVASPNDAVSLELPLRVIAPMFLSQQRPTQPRQRAKVGEAIPDLFGPGTVSHDTSSFKRATVPVASGSADIWEMQVGSAKAAAAMQTLPKLEAVGHTPAGAPASASNPGTSFLAKSTIDVIFDEPGKQNWTPTEVVRKTSRLKSVAGACMFTADGLLIAEQYPALAGVDTFCALVTQMYNRVFSHAMELRLGGPVRMSFAAEGVTYDTYKCGRVYLTVISQPGEKLPQAELLVIADYLTRQSR